MTTPIRVAPLRAARRHPRPGWATRGAVAASTPFGAAPIALPGVIQVEDFDAGGEGVGYGDVDPAMAPGGSFHLSVDGRDVTGPSTCPAPTGGRAGGPSRSRTSPCRPAATSCAW